VSKFVLDASALLAALHGEPDVDQWSDAIADSVISAVNLSEVVSKLVDAGLQEGDIRGAVEPLGLTVVPFDDVQAWTAGFLRTLTRATGLSLGDRACLALGRSMKLPVLTADQAWKSLRVGVQVRLVRS